MRHKEVPLRSFLWSRRWTLAFWAILPFIVIGLLECSVRQNKCTAEREGEIRPYDRIGAGTLRACVKGEWRYLLLHEGKIEFKP